MPEGTKQALSLYPAGIDLGPITLDAVSRDAFRDGAALHLTSREFDLLYLMAHHRNEPLAAAWIFQNVWGYAAERGSNALSVSVGRLRAKIELDVQRPRLLMNIRGFGYKLVTGSG